MTERMHHVETNVDRATAARAIEAATLEFINRISTSSDIVPEVPLPAIERLREAARSLATLSGAGKYVSEQATIAEFLERVGLRSRQHRCDDDVERRLPAILRRAQAQLGRAFPVFH